MAVCEVCKREMLEADGCIGGKLIINGKAYPRIRVGDPDDFYPEAIENREHFRCGDCNAKFGHYHHWGCDAEKCPKCHGQLISCSCDDNMVLRYSARER